MSSNVTKALCASLVVAGVLSGCMTTPSVGTKAGDVPPKIIIDPNDSKNRTWDNPGAFGPVPTALAEKGQATCSTLDTKDVQFKAIGYHPGALQLDGKPFPSGGYFCVPK